jgi:hypothetical protein
VEPRVFLECAWIIGIGLIDRIIGSASTRARAIRAQAGIMFFVFRNNNTNCDADDDEEHQSDPTNEL